MSQVIDTLRAYARKQVNTDAVMRAITEHREYLVPVTYLAAMGTDVADRIVMLDPSGGPAPGELWIFTDEEHVQAAAAVLRKKGHPLGAYALPFDGARVLAALDERLLKVKINPALELSTFWYMGQEAIPLAKLWSQVITLERAIRDRGDPDGGAARMADRMRDFPGWLCMAHPNGAIVTATDMAGFKNAALIFTAPDCMERVRDELAEPSLREVGLAGQPLFTMLTKAGVDGIIVNLSGPGPTLVSPVALASVVIGGARSAR